MPSIQTLATSLILALSAATPIAHAEAPAISVADDASAVASTASVNGAAPAAIRPYTRGFNASLASLSQHDSSNGWSSVLTPAIAWRFNSVFSVDASVPIYAYIHVEAHRGSKAKPLYQLITRNGVPGDTSLAVHAETHRLADYVATFSFGLPTGNSSYGLGAGQTTFSFNNHVEKSLGPVSPDIEFGIANTSSLNNRGIRRSFTSVGLIAHLQAGAAVDLPRNLSFSADAYEDLPLVPGTVFSTTGRGRKKVGTTSSAPSAEDNGINTSLDIPLSPRATLSGLYSRSLRTRDDVAGLSLVLLLRAPPRQPDLPF